MNSPGLFPLCLTPQSPFDDNANPRGKVDDATEHGGRRGTFFITDVSTLQSHLFRGLNSILVVKLLENAFCRRNQRKRNSLVI